MGRPHPDRPAVGAGAVGNAAPAAVPLTEWAGDPLWDPRLWAEPSRWTTLTVSPCGERYVILDIEDYEWASRWRWSLKPSRGGRKFYAYRVGRDCGRRRSIYLHVEIMRRTGIPCPWEDAVVDHRSGQEWDCRRSNPRWATRSMNRRNINGCCPGDLFPAGP